MRRGGGKGELKGKKGKEVKNKKKKRKEQEKEEEAQQEEGEEEERRKNPIYNLPPSVPVYHQQHVLFTSIYMYIL
jgi:hypothetical protein